MSLLTDLKTIYHLTLAPRRGNSHAERMETFYRGQAAAYDGFRERLLQGRRELITSLPWTALRNEVWVDLGAGTGANAELAGDSLASLSSVHWVDLSPSLLEVAQSRARKLGWRNVTAHQADATRFCPPEGQAGLVTFSYSLTMIPDWSAAIDHALEILRPGGLIAVVDFHVSRKHETAPRSRHGWWTRTFWPTWFAMDNVFLSSEHTHYLQRRFEMVSWVEARAKLPYLPLGTVPYYRFVGRKPESGSTSRSGPSGASAASNPGR
jgi:S-adenosylmethionine-diacylgycerolhomoserine-N-methlytransferase